MTTLTPARAGARVLACAGLAVALALPAAKADAHSGPKGNRTQPVTIAFTAVNGATPVDCSTPLVGLGTGNTTAALKDLRFYISNVRLVRPNGSSVPLRLTGDRKYNATVGADRVTLIDLENGTGACTGDRDINRAIRGTVPAGRYVGARMQLGVPFALNHTDVTTAPRPLDLTALTWGWQAGRKFAQIEITDPEGARGTWSARTFFFHLGSTGCTGNPATGETASCARSNRAAIRLARFNPARQRVAVNLRALLLGNDVTRNQAAAPGCMSGPTDPECGPIFNHALGISWNPDGTGTGQPIGGGKGQRLFRVIPR